MSLWKLSVDLACSQLHDTWSTGKLCHHTWRPCVLAYNHVILYVFTCSLSLTMFEFHNRNSPKILFTSRSIPNFIWFSPETKTPCWWSTSPNFTWIHIIIPPGIRVSFWQNSNTHSFSPWNKDTLIAETLDQIPTYAHRMLSFGWLHCWGSIWCHRKPLTIVKITNGPLSTLAHCPCRDSVTPSRPL